MPRFTLPLDEKGPLLNVVVEVSGARSALLRSLGQTALAVCQSGPWSTREQASHASILML